MNLTKPYLKQLIKEMLGETLNEIDVSPTTADTDVSPTVASTPSRTTPSAPKPSPRTPGSHPSAIKTYPSTVPAGKTTAEVSPEEFIQMIETWGKEGSGSKKTAEDVFKALGDGDIEKGRLALSSNYEGLRNKVEAEKGTIKRVDMPVVKKSFVQDLFNRLEAGKLDWNSPMATGGEDAAVTGDIAIQKIKKKKTKKLKF